MPAFKYCFFGSIAIAIISIVSIFMKLELIPQLNYIFLAKVNGITFLLAGWTLTLMYTKKNMLSPENIISKKQVVVNNVLLAVILAICLAIVSL